MIEILLRPRTGQPDTIVIVDENGRTDRYPIEWLDRVMSCRHLERIEDVDAKLYAADPNQLRQVNP